MRNLLLLFLSLALVSCSITVPEPSRAAIVHRKLSKGVLGVGGDSVSQIQFDPAPASCATAHLSAVWYESEDVTECWDRNLNENYHDVQATNAFTVLMALPAAMAPILALKLWN